MIVDDAGDNSADKYHQAEEDRCDALDGGEPWATNANAHWGMAHYAATVWMLCALLWSHFA